MAFKLKWYRFGGEYETEYDDVKDAIGEARRMLDDGSAYPEKITDDEGNEVEWERDF